MSADVNRFLTQEEIKACVKILSDRGPTYQTAIGFFPRWMADRVAVLYAFVRVPDDIVDETPDKAQAAKDLARWKADWYAALEHPEKANNVVLRANAKLFRACGMPREYWEAFFQAMEWDLVKDRYETMEDLKAYMYGSASVVGLMLLQIMPHETSYDEATKRQAQQLGYAMQLTNFLRDVAEDWRERRRIYLPQDILAHYGIDELYFENEVCDEAWEKMMDALISVCRGWYENASYGIEKLPGRLQGAVGVSSVLYQRYLEMIEASGYRVWDSMYSMSSWQKLRIAVPVYFLKRY